MKSFRASPCIAFACALLAAPTLAFAQDAPPPPGSNANADHPSLPAVSVNTPSGAFGDKGQIAVSSDSAISIQHTSISGVDTSVTTITLLPAVDYFVAHNLSVGGFVGLDYAKAGSAHSTVFEIGPRVGYNLVLSNHVSFWPKLGLSYKHASIGGTVVAGGSGAFVDGDHLTLNVFAPVMFHPATHFFVGFGPNLDVDLTGDAKETSVGARLTIGGWVGPWK
jgi:hypothetical protein